MAIRHPKNLQLERNQHTTGRALPPLPVAQKGQRLPSSIRWHPACSCTTRLGQLDPLTRSWILQGEAKPSWSSQGLRAQGECLRQRQQLCPQPTRWSEAPILSVHFRLRKCSSNLPRCFFSFKLATDDFCYLQSRSWHEYICRTKVFNA